MIGCSRLSWTGLVRTLPVLVLAGLLGPDWIGVAEAAGPTLQPHRAVYDLGLGQTRADSTVVEATGLLEFEWSAACDGWTVSQRARVELAHDDGPGISFGWVYNSWEAKDGTDFRFYVRRLYGGGQSEQIKGAVKMETLGGGGVAHFTLPEERDIEVPEGFVFPTRHTLSLLAHLEEDGLPFFAGVFDGSTDEGYYEVSAILVPGDDEMRSQAEAFPALAKAASWRLNLAFFGNDSTISEPEQEQELRIFSNGITDEVTFDYGDFALDAMLRELETLPAPDC